MNDESKPSNQSKPAEKQKLVVIGNGMAGARAVEEILARGGGDQFEITMFGDEPHGNYNRILLSNVLNGSYNEEEIFLNPLAWYAENNIRLLKGTRAAGLLRRAKLAFAEDGTPEPYDKLIIATSSRPLCVAIRRWFIMLKSDTCVSVTRVTSLK